VPDAVDHIVYQQAGGARKDGDVIDIEIEWARHSAPASCDSGPRDLEIHRHHPETFP
jgi:hypothetical protein